MNKKIIIGTCTLLTIIISVEATIISINCNEENLKCNNPIINNNTISFNIGGRSYLNAKINYNNTKTIKIILKNITKSNTYTYNLINATIKTTCNRREFKIIRPTLITNNTKEYNIETNCKPIYISTYYTYTTSRTNNKIDEWKTRTGIKATYPKMLNNKSLPILIISNNDGNKTKKNIVMIVRQHPAEIYSSFYIEGLINSINNETLKKVNILIIPQSNPTGVNKGLSQTNDKEQDLNDCWNSNNCNEVEIIKTQIKNFNEKYGKIDLFIDWHGTIDGSQRKDATLYENEKEKILAKQLANNTNFKSIGQVNSTPEQSRNYMKKTYNATSITLEIQQTYEENTHSINNMLTEGAKILEVITK